MEYFLILMDNFIILKLANNGNTKLENSNQAY